MIPFPRRPEGAPPAHVPRIELRYLGEVVGWLDCATVFEPANEDAVWINSAMLERYAA